MCIRVFESKDSCPYFLGSSCAHQSYIMDPAHRFLFPSIADCRHANKTVWTKSYWWSDHKCPEGAVGKVGRKAG